MNANPRILLTVTVLALSAANSGFGDEASIAPLPEGVTAVWDFDKAYRETTETRERICINGLWLWQPARGNAEQVPAGNWGWFKVPGCWPGTTDYLQKDCQTVFPHASWKDERLANVTAAWYEREMTVPRSWDGRRISLSAEFLNSLAVVYVDGRKAGEITFPGGELDLTAACRPGVRQTLSLLVVALPLKGVLLSYTDTNTAREVKGQVQRRGLCGDVFLIGGPKAAAIVDVKVETSVRKREITFEAALASLTPGVPYSLRAQVTAGGRAVRQFQSPVFTADDLKAGRFAFTEAWLPDRLWDIDTPQNQYDVALSLLDPDGNVLDTSFNARFGFREFWIDGRDFYLNGRRIFLSCVPLDNAQISAAAAGYDAARESLERLKSFGINFVYTHNYGCEPGSHLSFAEILRAADYVGMLVAFSQPHFAHYDWENPEADSNNGYARHAEFYVRAAQNHPAVVAYATSHNATGYNEDMNPDMIDGIHDPRGAGELRNVRKALRAENIIKRLDASRIVYHHSSGNLGAMHTSNFYPNFAPVQELSDWFEHWATEGVKPVFTCEYGAPFSWDWAMYRGWYKGERSFGSARVPWDFCLAEWNSQFLGDAAFRTNEAEKANLRWEARQMRDGKLWFRWDYPQSLNSKVFDERYPIIAKYLTENWRAFRTWGVSAISPWEHEQFWKLREGVDKSRRELRVDWQKLQSPGFSADYLGQRYERMDLAYERGDWQPTAAAQALLRNNMPLLGYVAGKREAFNSPAAFTSKDHLFLPGEIVEKQAIVINNSRRRIECACEWSLDLPQAISGSGKVTLGAGEQARVLLKFELPKALAPGDYTIAAAFKFDGGETQTDSFAIRVVPRPRPLRVPPSRRVSGRIALFDPAVETGLLLRQLGIGFEPVEADADLSEYDMLIVGQKALAVDGRAPDITRVRDGLRVLIFEQTADVLEKRFGFRIAEYALRNVFPRVPDHPVIAGIGGESWRDWRGSAMLLPERLTYELRPRHGPTVKWCDIEVPRLWRCGNRGNVASVLIEKPARGDFLPIVDGGYSLQYSPLMEYREVRGMIVFCQLDVTVRTEADPIARTLVRNLVRYVADWKAEPKRSAVYVGEPAGKAHLEMAGVFVRPYEPGKLKVDDVLIAGPGCGKNLAADATGIANWLSSGGHLLAVGLNEADLKALPLSIGVRKAEHISASFEPFAVASPLAGVGPADVHNRDPRELALITTGATVFGDGVLAQAENRNIIFCQLAPWQFAGSKQVNLRKTFRRTSFLVTRLLANMGVAGTTPVLDRFHAPVPADGSEKRWLEGLYLDQPEEWDDPYRFFRW